MRELFAGALDVDVDARGRWLERHCLDDDALREDVQRLLAAHHAPGGVLDHGRDLLASVVATFDEDGESVDRHIGSRIGAYRLLRLLGRGDMGGVYLAERADGQFRQQVALKLIHDDLPVRGLHERFLRERDILARLSHPNIAQLHDGGVSDAGVPYFTLEVVEGEPITQWCDARQLGPRARLEIALKVCEAVQYAHRNLVVHRDLKPSNILVNAAGEPKLLDFGIAKFLDAEPAGGVMTDAHQGPMTREYAAPEQVLAQPITTLTDVYSLGVLVYELLCGRMPYPNAARGTTSWPKAIVEEAPESLSRAVTRPSVATGMDEGAHTPAADVFAARRGMPVAALRRALRGELDAIALRALEKAPEARYASVAELGDAVRAWLDGRALPGGGLRYRAGKFLRRHAVAASVTTALVLVALTGVAGVVWEARKTAMAGERAQATQQFLASVFDVSDPDRAQGKDVTARELLDEGARRAQTELAGQPQLQADLLRLIGTLYFRLGLYPRAEALQAQAIALQRALDPRGGQLALTLTEIAQTDRLEERYPEAERQLGEALAFEQGHGMDDARARTLGILGETLGATARNQDAERVLREALAIDRRLHAAPDEQIAADQERLARVLDTESGYDEASMLLSDSLQQRRQLHGERHSTVAATLEERGKLAWTRGDLIGAERDFTSALEMRRALFGSRHPIIADNLYWIAALRCYQGRYAEAEALIDEALSINRDAFGADTAHDAPHHDLLAEVAQAGNDLDRAEHEARTALEIWRRVLGEHQSEFSNGLQRLALIERDRGNTAEAIGMLQQAVGIRRAALGPDNERVGFALANLGETQRIGGDDAAAVDAFTQALAIYRTCLPPNHSRVVESLSGLGHSQLDSGDAVGAIATLERARTMSDVVYPAAHPDRVRVLLPLGEAYLVNGDPGRAADVLGDAQRVMAAVGATHVRNAVQTLTLLGRAHTGLDRYRDADADLAGAQALLAAHPQDTRALAAGVAHAQEALTTARVQASSRR
jgi:serine/threonine protein kinase